MIQKEQHPQAWDCFAGVEQVGRGLQEAYYES